MASPMLEQLLQGLKSTNSRVREHSARRLSRSAFKAAISPLIEALKDEEDFVAGAAATALGGICSRLREGYPDLARTAVVPLVQRLESNWSVTWDAAKCACAEALGQIGLSPDLVIPSLAVTIRRADLYFDDLTAAAAAEALGRFGTPAAPTVPVLLDLLEKSRFEYVRAACATALGQVGHKSPAVLAVLRQAAVDDDCGYVRFEAACALEELEHS